MTTSRTKKNVSLVLAQSQSLSVVMADVSEDPKGAMASSIATMGVTKPIAISRAKNHCLPAPTKNSVLKMTLFAMVRLTVQTSLMRKIASAPKAISNVEEVLNGVSRTNGYVTEFLTVPIEATSMTQDVLVEFYVLGMQSNAPMENVFRNIHCATERMTAVMAQMK